MARWIQLSRRRRPQGREYFEGNRGNKCRDDFEMDPSREERDRSYMYASKYTAMGRGPEYATPRGQGLVHRVASSGHGEWGTGQDMKSLIPTYREQYWQERGGGRRSPPRTTGVGWNRDHSRLT